MKHNPTTRPQTLLPSQHSLNLVRLQRMAKTSPQARELLEKTF
ncbi:MAG: hypothetical protein AAF959_05270 [Cyanobacteria bacterium P01_D01_bin.56]